MKDLLSEVEKLEDEGYLVLLKWDGERSSKKRTTYGRRSKTLFYRFGVLRTRHAEQCASLNYYQRGFLNITL
jgi:hypothetical protein